MSALSDKDRLWVKDLLSAALPSPEVPNGADLQQYMGKERDVVEKFSDVYHSSDEDDALVRTSLLTVPSQKS